MSWGFGKLKPIHPGRLTWNIIMEVWFRSFSFLNGWFVCSMLIFQGVGSMKLAYLPTGMVIFYRFHVGQSHGSVMGNNASLVFLITTFVVQHMPSIHINTSVMRIWSHYLIMDGLSSTWCIEALSGVIGALNQSVEWQKIQKFIETTNAVFQHVAKTKTFDFEMSFVTPFLHI